ncbi:MAG TPA: histidine kinase dimerization/phospho-acceptor domain-containing protein, partial [Vicinamibacterales bacterium]|nr:histidine kinase dimerization/phospho-acceptor domain-containing protein [Vicinamibacterales bacterium]
MRVSLRTRQTAAVTLLIALAMTVLSVQHLANLARAGLEDSRGVGELLGRMIYQRARDAIAAGGDPATALRTDQGIRSILESTTYGRNITYAAVVDNEGRAIAHNFPAAEGQKIEPGENLAAVLDRNMLAQIRTIYADRALEVVLPLELGDAPFGAIRVGLSPVLIRDDLAEALRPMLLATMLLSAAAILVGLVLATRILRPIHVINSGLMRLGRGEKVGSIELPPDEELEGVGESFRAISEKLAARSLGRLMAGVTHEVRNPLNAMTIHLELVREHLLSLQRNARAPVGAVLGLEGHEEPPHEVSGAREHLDVIASEIKRLDEVITGFVRFIRPEELQLNPVDVKALIAEVIALVEPDAKRSGITCRAEVADRIPELRADPALLRQALLNLALNACQAMPEGGKLVMEARVEKDR